LLGAEAPGGLFSVALSLRFPSPGVTRHRVSMEPGLSSPPEGAAVIQPADAVDVVSRRGKVNATPPYCRHEDELQMNGRFSLGTYQPPYTFSHNANGGVSVCETFK